MPLHPTRVRFAVIAPLAILLALPLVVGTGCEHGDTRLTLADLSHGEREFLTRFVILERARAVAQADPPVGAALLDSLAAAWGDSAIATARAQLANDPLRAAEVYDLLGRILSAEADSLAQAPVARRLRAPLPRPAPGPETVSPR